MHDFWYKIKLYGTISAVFFLPYEKRKHIERNIRGKEEFRKLSEADWVLVSWAKSGRTWLRVMLSHYYQQRFNIPQQYLLDFDNFKIINPQAPSVFFTHGNYLKDYTGNKDTKRDFYHKKIVLLVRDPRDVAVSQYFQWKYRMSPRKKSLNDYPPHEADISMYAFVTSKDCGLPKVIDYFNGWIREKDKVANLLMVRYEDMRKNPEQVMRSILEFTGTPGSEQQIRETVEFSAYQNMKKHEEKQTISNNLGRLGAKQKGNPNSSKVRRAKVGGYKDYFDEQQLKVINTIMRDQLLPELGYLAD
ncbi:MAG TPA: sulfotransferase [Crenotrichaceae bacterium]|nr:sulfotransferase [Crenotrichaceae bacterium]